MAAEGQCRGGNRGGLQGKTGVKYEAGRHHSARCAAPAEKPAAHLDPQIAQQALLLVIVDALFTKLVLNKGERGRRATRDGGRSGAAAALSGAVESSQAPAHLYEAGKLACHLRCCLEPRAPSTEQLAWVVYAAGQEMLCNRGWL